MAEALGVAGGLGVLLDLLAPGGGGGGGGGKGSRLLGASARGGSTTTTIPGAAAAADSPPPVQTCALMLLSTLCDPALSSPSSLEEGCLPENLRRLRKAEGIAVLLHRLELIQVGRGGAATPCVNHTLMQTHNAYLLPHTSPH